MAEQAVRDGISVMAATPHAFAGKITSMKAVMDRVRRLQAVLDTAGLDLRLVPGSEVPVFPGVALQILAGRSATLNGSGYVLMELPPMVPPATAFDELFQLRSAGVTPIIAHPERHPLFLRDPQRMAAFSRIGCLVQVTAMSLTGEAGPAPMACAQKLLISGMAHLIASDAHDSRHRPPKISRALEAAEALLGSRTAVVEFAEKRPMAILEGREVAANEPQPFPTLRKRFSELRQWFRPRGTA